jgi:PKHD-type hydroxylase
MQSNIIQVLDPVEAEEIRAVLAREEWQEGKARTKELTGFIKRNKELKPNQGNDIVDAYCKRLTSLVSNTKGFVMPTMLKQMTGFKFNLYGAEQPGGEYKAHTDAPWMGPVRTDFTVILALTDPDTYEGGDHWVVTPFGERTCFRPKQGELMFYETGYRHWVEPVTKGSRISALAWAESNMPDEKRRACSLTMHTLSRAFETEMYNEENSQEAREQFRSWFVDCGVVHSQLQREWSSPRTA